MEEGRRGAGELCSAKRERVRDDYVAWRGVRNARESRRCSACFQGLLRRANRCRGACVCVERWLPEKKRWWSRQEVMMWCWPKAREGCGDRACCLFKLVRLPRRGGRQPRISSSGLLSRGPCSLAVVGEEQKKVEERVRPGGFFQPAFSVIAHGPRQGQVDGEFKQTTARMRSDYVEEGVEN